MSGFSLSNAGFPRQYKLNISFFNFKIAQDVKHYIKTEILDKTIEKLKEEGIIFRGFSADFFRKCFNF